MTAFAIENRNRASFAEINVTPLVDVMLVLLIIFMLAVPLTTQRMHLDLPLPGREAPPPSTPLNLSLKQTGEMYWNGAPITRAGVATEFTALAARADAPPVALRAEPATRYQYVADVLAIAKNAQLQRISIEPSR